MTLKFSFRRYSLAGALLAAFASAPASAFLLLNDEHIPEQQTDLRPGKLLPSAGQLARVSALKAKANWNRFGTVHSLIRHGGYLGQGYGGSPVEGARAWIRDNRELFKLSEQSIADLEVVNQGVMPHTEARAVLFRQRFGGMRVSHDGLITVGIVNGKIYYVSSSSAGDQPLPGPAKLGPLQAWLRAAADIKRVAAPADVLFERDATDQTGWHLFDVVGFAQTQRARLVALPIPAGGVRQAYETIVLDMQAHVATAYVHFIDAETGAVLRRENRLQNYADTGVPAQAVSGSLMNSLSCGMRHDVAVPAGSAARFTAAAVVPTNKFVLNLYRSGAKVGSAEMTGNGSYRYAPAEGVAAGNYQLEVCPRNQAGAHFLPPYNYVATLENGADATNAGPLYNTAKWRWFPSEPLLTLETTDIRKLACFGPAAEGCDYDFTGPAARQPWDMLAGLVPTFTSIGNSAITTESPITAVIAGAPFPHVMTPSPLRNYDYAWSNQWYESGCSPVNSIGAVLPGNVNDIDASIANLFVAHNRMHDWAYGLGFTETNYNLQVSNFGQTDITAQNDPELGMAQATGPAGGWPLYLGRDNANQATLQDGVPGITQQYLFQSIAGSFYAPCTDGGYSMAIVGHEYTHATSNRMIGGPDEGIGGHQGGSMGESWGDLSALEHMYESGYLQETADPTALATYVSGGIGTGFRDYPLAVSPLNYSNVGFDTPGPEVHSDGEIWNAVQWVVRQQLVDKYNDQYAYDDMALQRRCAEGIVSPEACPGNRRWVQTLYDAFLLMPAAPSMLDARDAQLAADMARFGGADQKELWAGFAKGGMGATAFSFDGSDVAPIPAFDTPLGDNAEVSFSAKDASGAGIAGARLYVGRFATRSRYVADTDPETVEPDTVKMVPGEYEFIVEAPGYGQHRFKRTLAAGAVKLAVSLPNNWASLAKGAVVTTSASLPENIDLADNLIDETEDTGALFGDEGLVAGATITVQLSGGEQSISRVNVSTAAGPDNPGRFTGIYGFEIRVCSGTCADPQADFETVAFTAEQGFPARKARPLQPDLIMRSFEFAPVKATHVQLRALSSQCTGNADYAGEQDSDPLNSTDCATTQPPPPVLDLDPTTIITPPGPPSNRVRATEFQVFSGAATVEGGSEGQRNFRFGGAMPLFGLIVLIMAGALRSSYRRSR